jgi:hypothetical protein
MGMRDESWCNGCGTSVPYDDADETYCGDCSADNVTQDLLSFLTGRIADLTAMREDAELSEDWSEENYLAGCIDAYDIVRMKLTK